MPKHDFAIAGAAQYPASAYRLRFVLSAVFFLLVCISLFLGASPLSTGFMAVLGCVFGGKLIWRGAWAGLADFFFSEDVFAAFAVLCALGYGFWNMALPIEPFNGARGLFAEALFFLCVVNWVKISRVKYSEGQAVLSKKVERFLPRSARIIGANGKDVKVFASEIQKGDRLLVRKGELVPVDGTVLSGETEIDEHLSTGIMLPAVKQKGGKVFSGSLNLVADIVVECGGSLKETQLWRIVDALKNNAEEKRYLPLGVFRYGRAALPAAIVAACAACFLLYKKSGYAGAEYYISLAFFFVFFSIPCAVFVNRGISGFFAVKRAGGCGMRVRGVTALETFKNADILFLDKTGTVTEGRLKVQMLLPHKKELRAQFEQALFTAESRAEGPFAGAVKNHFKNKKLKPARVLSFEVIVGKGVAAHTEKQLILAGNAALFEEHKVAVPEPDSEVCGGTVIYVAADGVFLGRAFFTDSLRPGAAQTVQALEKSGKEVVLMTGDNAQAVACVKEELGVEKTLSDLMPSGKENEVIKAKREGLLTAMAGDGFNDALALFRADVSVVFSSSPQAHTVFSDIWVKNGAVTSLGALLKIYKSYNRIVIENIILALFAAACFLLFLYYNKTVVMPWYGGVLFMTGGILLIAVNSMRLLIRKI